MLRLHLFDAWFCLIICIHFVPFSWFFTITRKNEHTDSESPALPLVGATSLDPLSPGVDVGTNQISASYEVEQFPIEQIEKKLMLQRHLTAKWVNSFVIRCTIPVLNQSSVIKVFSRFFLDCAINIRVVNEVRLFWYPRNSIQNVIQVKF